MSVRYEVDGRVATFTLDRPEQRNAVDPDLARELGAAVADLGVGLRLETDRLFLCLQQQLFVLGLRVGENALGLGLSDSGAVRGRWFASEVEE